MYIVLFDYLKNNTVAVIGGLRMNNLLGVSRFHRLNPAWTRPRQFPGESAINTPPSGSSGRVEVPARSDLNHSTANCLDWVMMRRAGQGVGGPHWSSSWFSSVRTVPHNTRIQLVIARYYFGSRVRLVSTLQGVRLVSTLQGVRLVSTLQRCEISQYTAGCEISQYTAGCEIGQYTAGCEISQYTAGCEISQYTAEVWD
jgi:hypothetical protein